MSGNIDGWVDSRKSAVAGVKTIESSLAAGEQNDASTVMWIVYTSRFCTAGKRMYASTEQVE